MNPPATCSFALRPSTHQSPRASLRGQRPRMHVSPELEDVNMFRSLPSQDMPSKARFAALPGEATNACTNLPNLDASPLLGRGSQHKPVATKSPRLLDAFHVLDSTQTRRGYTTPSSPVSGPTSPRSHSGTRYGRSIHASNEFDSQSSARCKSIKTKLRALLRWAGVGCRLASVGCSTGHGAIFIKPAKRGASPRPEEIRKSQLWQDGVGVLYVGEDGLYVELVLVGQEPVHLPVYVPPAWVHEDCISVPLRSTEPSSVESSFEAPTPDQYYQTGQYASPEACYEGIITPESIATDSGLSEALHDHRLTEHTATSLLTPLPRAQDTVQWEVTQLNTITIDTSVSSAPWSIAGVLGEGTYGRVYLVYHRMDRKEAAMKVIYHKRPLPLAVCIGITNELRVAELLATQYNHLPFVLCPTLIHGKWAWQSSEGFVHIVTPFCPGGDLYDYMGRISEDTLRLVVAELVLGIESLHGLGIVHHDLKPENIVIDSRGHCRITDFGGSKFLPADSRLSSAGNGDIVATLPYAAPELVATDGLLASYDGPAIDMWSLGAVIMSLILGTEYFDRDTWQGLRDSTPYLVSKIKPTLERTGRCSPELIDLAQILLDVDPVRRANVPTAKSHPFFQRLPYSWDVINARDRRFIPPFSVVRPIAARRRELESTCKNWPTRDASFIAEDGQSCCLADELRREGIFLDMDNSFDVPTMHYEMLRA